MKTFKWIDLWISIILITGFTIASLIRFDEAFIIGYFIVSVWQFISMIVHEVNGWFTPKRSPRRIYHVVITMIMVIAIAGFAVNSLLFPFYLLVFTAPFMVIGYPILCYEEISFLKQRPLSLLK